MGTSGYKCALSRRIWYLDGCSLFFRVYRHRGRFYTQFVSHDTYPRGLGLELMHSVPKEPRRYAEWITERRKFFDEVQAQVVDEEHPEYTITFTTPKFDDFICYIYEIDLDHHTYHYGGFPMFRLDNLPPDEIFEKSIGKDGFGHATPTEALPEEHMYRMRPIMLPKPLDIEEYEAYREPTGKFDALQAILDAHSVLSDAQESCVRLFEVIACSFVHSYALGSALGSSELYCDDADDVGPIPKFVAEAALKFLLSAFLPMHYDMRAKNGIDAQYEARRADYLWIYYNLCAKAAVDWIDRDSVLRGAVGDLVRHIRGTGKEGVVYGVLCSLFHVVIVRVDMGDGGRFEHTPALTFLPPRLGHGPWAQGIEAVMKLSFHLQDALFELDVDPRGAEPPQNTHAPRTYFDKLPLEIIQQIVADIECDRFHACAESWRLVALGSLNEKTRIAVAPRVFSPTVGLDSLMGVVETNAPGRTRWKWLADLFMDHEGRCIEHRRGRCGLYVGHGDQELRGIPIFKVGRVGALTVTASHMALGEYLSL